jgi:hypothetical protein
MSVAFAQPDAAALAPLVNRKLTGGLEDALARFADTDMLAQGKIVLISLDPVAEAFGKRWPMRADQVYEHVDRTVERMVGLQGESLRVSETDYLICQPEAGRFLAQAVGLRVLREVVGHFLGAAHLADAGVHEVVKVSNGVVEARQVDATDIEVLASNEVQPRAAAPAAPSQDAAWAPFVTSDGRMLKVSCSLEPVFELKMYNRIGMRMSRRVWISGSDRPATQAQIGDLARGDVLRADLATIARGVDRLHSEAASGREPTLIVPISYLSLTCQRGRVDIINALKAAASLVKQGLICEICNIEGVPQSALLTAIGLIRPYSLYVIGRLVSPEHAGRLGLADAGLQGLSFELAAEERGAEFMGGLKTSIQAARKVSRSVMVHGAVSTREMGLIAVLGASHASLRGS